MLYSEERIKQAFWKEFHKSGELWFPYSTTNGAVTEEDCTEVTEAFWDSFLEYLKET